MQEHPFESLSLGINPRREVGPNRPCVIVAEIGQNHNGRCELAEQLIDAAAWAGADAVKVVKRDLGCELSRAGRVRPYPSQHSFGRTYGEHRAALELFRADHARLRDRARHHGLLYIATVCDEPSAELMDTLDVDAFKIASRDASNDPLLENVARRGRPVLLSTGMSPLAEIDQAMDLLRQYTMQIGVLQCTSLYPAPTHQVHLRSLHTLRRRYARPVGFSDHTRGILLAPVAVAMGAMLIEKHFTLDRTMKGTDHNLSVEPEELRQMIENIRQVERALGSPDKPVAPGIEEVRQRLGRSLTTRWPIPSGTPLSEDMLMLKSPGDGIAWSQRWRVLGRRLKRDVSADEQLSVEDVA